MNPTRASTPLEQRSDLSSAQGAAWPSWRTVTALAASLGSTNSVSIHSRRGQESGLKTVTWARPSAFIREATNCSEALATFVEAAKDVVRNFLASDRSEERRVG